MSTDVDLAQPVPTNYAMVTHEEVLIRLNIKHGVAF